MRHRLERLRNQCLSREAVALDNVCRASKTPGHQHRQLPNIVIVSQGFFLAASVSLGQYELAHIS